MKYLQLLSIVMLMLLPLKAMPQCTLISSQSPNQATQTSLFNFGVTNENGQAVGGQYTWEVMVGGVFEMVADAGNTPSYQKIISETTQYRLTALLSGCDEQQFSFLALIAPVIPTPSPIANHGSTCGSGAIQLSVIYKSNYLYEWYESGTGTKLTLGTGMLSSGESYALGGQGYSELYINNVTTTLSFYVTGTNQSNPSGGSPGTTVNAYVYPFPEVSAGENQSVCINGGTVALSGSPAGGTWSGNGVAGNTFNPLAGSGNHTLTYSYTNSFGCTRTVQKSISVIELSAPVTQDKVIPFNSATTLTATGAGVNESYRWYSVTDVFLASGITYTTGNLSQTTNTFKVSKINTVNQCESSGKSFLNVIANRPAEVNAGEDLTRQIPVGTLNIVGEASDPDGSITNLVWDKISGPQVTMTNVTMPVLVLSNPTAGNYTFRLTATDNYSYVSFDEMNLAVVYPPDNYNYVKEHTALIKGIVDHNDHSSRPVNEKAMVTNYYDGLGRPMQTVAWSTSVGLKDVVQPVVYDALGRESQKYLPYASSESNGQFKNSPISDVVSFYSRGGSISKDAMPFAKTIFEASPLNRVMQQGAPGTSWQPVNNDPYSMDASTIKKRYLLNRQDEVLLMHYETATASVAIDNAIYHGVNTLYANKTFDEKNNDVIEYVDKEGRTVCKKVYSRTESNIKHYAETYYLYDDFGNLVVVLPPEGVEKLKANLN